MESIMIPDLKYTHISGVTEYISNTTSSLEERQDELCTICISYSISEQNYIQIRESILNYLTTIYLPGIQQMYGNISLDRKGIRKKIILFTLFIQQCNTYLESRSN